MDITGCVVDNPVVRKHKHPAFFFFFFFFWGGGGGALWYSHCQLLGRGDPISKSQGNSSFLESCCEPSCERQADTILHKEFHLQFELQSVVHIFQVANLVVFSQVFPGVFFLLCLLLGVGKVRV